jgi:hypothetical protein
MKTCIAIFFVFTLISCNFNQDGFSHLDENVSVRLEAFGDGKNAVATSTFYELEFSGSSKLMPSALKCGSRIS